MPESKQKAWVPAHIPPSPPAGAPEHVPWPCCSHPSCRTYSALLWPPEGRRDMPVTGVSD
eukprot:scaffold330780_cov47-Prasinocladus_malaysianus.AAC.2